VTAGFINESFIPCTIHIKRLPALFHRFDVLWTPTVLVISPDGKERLRMEGYLPTQEFRATLTMGWARVAFMNKKWKDAEDFYQKVISEHARTTSVPEAIYWRAVCEYKATGKHEPLLEVSGQLKDYPGSVWRLKSEVW